MLGHEGRNAALTFGMCGATSRVSSTALFTLISNILSMAPSGICSIGPAAGLTAALLMRTSMLAPYASWATCSHSGQRERWHSVEMP